MIERMLDEREQLDGTSPGIRYRVLVMALSR
jgi:hypothetical protein